MDTLLPGATSRDLVLQDTGYYALIASAYGFSDTSDCIQMVAIGIEEQGINPEQFLIYPNPSNGDVYLVHPMKEAFQLEIFQLNGNLINELSMNPEESKFKLPDDKGLYLIRVVDVQNQNILKVGKVLAK